VNLLDVSVGECTRNMWFQHEGIAAHFAREFREHFTSICEE